MLDQDPHCQCCETWSAIWCFFGPSGILDGKKIQIWEPGSGYFGDLGINFWVKNTYNLCCASGSGIRCLFDTGSRIRDGKIQIRPRDPDQQHWFLLIGARYLMNPWGSVLFFTFHAGEHLKRCCLINIRHILGPRESFPFCLENKL